MNLSKHPYFFELFRGCVDFAESETLARQDKITDYFDGGFSLLG